MSTKAVQPRLTSGWRLLRASVRDFRRNFWPIVLVTIVVVLPVNILGLIGSLGSDAGFTAYTTVASIFMNVALLYTVVRLLAHDEPPRLREAYYEGTARVLAFILASAAVIAMLIPAAFALTIYIIGSSSTEGATVSSGELALIGLVALLLAIPSLWLINRFVLAPYLVVVEGLTPMASLRRARALTLGRFWPVAGRLSFLGLALLVIAVAAVIPSFLLGLVFHSQTILLFLFQTLLSIIALPIADLYLVRLARQLSQAE